MRAKTSPDSGATGVGAPAGFGFAFASNIGMTGVMPAVRSWAAKRGAELALLARFGPMTARAYGALLRVIIAERLWVIPDRARRDIATGRSSP